MQAKGYEHFGLHNVMLSKWFKNEKRNVFIQIYETYQCYVINVTLFFLKDLLVLCKDQKDPL